MATEVAAMAKAAESPAGSTLLKIIGAVLPNGLVEPFRERIVERETLNKIDAAVGDALARQMAENPEVLARYQARLLSHSIVSQTNVEAVASAAIEHGALKSDAADNPEDDWINHFIPYAEKASSDRMRDLLGRILAGEIKKPGSYSLATLRVVNEISQRQAHSFLWFWGHSIGDAVPTTIVPGPGIEWSRIVELRDAGLVTPVDSATWQPQSSEGVINGSPWSIGPSHIFISVWPIGHGNFVNVYRPTPAGAEVATLIDPPIFEDNLRALAKTLHTKSFRIWLFKGGSTPEVLWESK